MRTKRYLVEKRNLRTQIKRINVTQYFQLFFIGFSHSCKNIELNVECPFTREMFTKMFHVLYKIIRKKILPKRTVGGKKKKKSVKGGGVYLNFSLAPISFSPARIALTSIIAFVITSLSRIIFKKIPGNFPTSFRADDMDKSEK